MAVELVTVVIPCYNASDYIDDTLNSVLAQREPEVVEVEIIVVDDASTDDSPAKTEASARTHPSLVRLLRQPANLGPAAARNVGLRNANGRFVCFLDADDQYAPGFFRQALAHFAERPQLAAILTGIELVNCHRDVDPVQLASIIKSLPSNVILRRSVAELLGGFPEDPCYRGRSAGEDSAFRTVLGKLFQVGFDSTKFLRYLVKPGSHFEYFLDRSKVVDQAIVLTELTAEEKSGAKRDALRKYEKRCRDRIAAAAMSVTVPKSGS